MKTLFSLYQKYRRVVNYLVVGGLTTLVALVVYYGCVFTVLDPEKPVQLQIANLISWVVAVTFAYVTNRKFVFESKNPDLLKEAASFYLARVGTLLLDMGIMFVAVTLLHLNDKIIKLFVQVVVTVVNYLFSKWFVFRKK